MNEMKQSAPNCFTCKCNLPNCVPSHKLVRRNLYFENFFTTFNFTK